jgi:hypothetical protein
VAREIQFNSGTATVQLAFERGAGETGLSSLEEVTHLRSVIKKQLNGYKTAVHIVKASSKDYVDRVILPFLKDQIYPQIRYRVGIKTKDKFIYDSWEQHYVKNYQVMESPDTTSAPTVIFTTVDFISVLDTVQRTYAWSGTPSEIVSQIWKKYNATGTTVIEPTDGQNKVYYQCQLSHLDFIRNRLIPRSANKQGVTNYNLYISNNELHYHTPGYGVTENRKIYLSWSNGSAPTDRMIIVDNTVDNIKSGAGGVITQVFDPLEGNGKYQSSDFSKVRPWAVTKNEAIEYLVLRGHIGQNGVSDERTITQYFYNVSWDYNYVLKFMVGSTIDLRIGDILVADVRKSKSAPSAFSGEWHVFALTETIVTGKLMTAVEAHRGGYNGSRERSTLPSNGFESVSGIPAVRGIASNISTGVTRRVTAQ